MNDSGELRTVSANLTAKHQRFLAALVSERSVEAAAKRAGIGKTTAWKWLRDPVFADALKRLELETLSEATRALIGLHMKAISTLDSVLDDPEASAGTRVRAASEVVNAMLKLRETIDHEGRIAALEERLNITEGRA